MPFPSPIGLTFSRWLCFQIFSREELMMIGRLAIEFDTLILSDEVCSARMIVKGAPSLPELCPNSPSIRQ
jgi:hypothetical protein